MLSTGYSPCRKSGGARGSPAQHDIQHNQTIYGLAVSKQPAVNECRGDASASWTTDYKLTAR